MKNITFIDIEKRLNHHLIPVLGRYPVAEISAPLAIEKLKPLEREKES
ncbi:hypothetical protein [Actinobacillus porcinus]|nr:hypothetical protein [Actinobacillus porcinus]